MRVADFARKHAFFRSLLETDVPARRSQDFVFFLGLLFLRTAATRFWNILGSFSAISSFRTETIFSIADLNFTNSSDSGSALLIFFRFAHHRLFQGHNRACSRSCAAVT